MHRTRSLEDPVRRWRQFCRAGWRMAWIFAALWFGALALLFRVAPAPAPAARASPAQVFWWPAKNGAAEGIRALWSPSAFALPTPAGFSHSLRGERARLAPPVQLARPDAAFLARPEPPASLDPSKAGLVRLASPEPPAESSASAGVFPPRTPEPEKPRMDFPEGWESRLFSGVDLNFGAWTNSAWSARIEMRFDAKGLPASTLLEQSSGLPEVDRRLARSANGWRLLEPAAPRTGVIAWSSPASAPGLSPAAGEEVP
jgi:hypothetical protein